MIELAALCLVFAAALVAYASDEHASATLAPWLLSRARSLAARVLACLMALAAFYLWYSVERGPAAFFAVALAAMLSATLIALAAPLKRKIILERSRKARLSPRAGRPSAGVTSAAVVGTLPWTLLAASAAARLLPLTADARYAVAFLGVIPLWILSMCLTFMFRHGLPAWITCVTLTSLLAWL